MTARSKRLIFLIGGILIGLALVVPIVRVMACSDGVGAGHCETTHVSIVGLPASFGVPAVIVILLAGIRAIIRSGRRV